MPKSSLIRRALLLCVVVPLSACDENPTGSDVDEILGCEQVAGIDFPSSASGSLTTNDCILGDGSYADFYSFRVSGSSQVTITMRSTQVDSYLLLLSTSGALLDSDDDSLGSGNSLIETTLSAGTYVIAANSFDAGETGSYTLRVE